MFILLLLVIVVIISAATWWAYRYKKKLLQHGKIAMCNDCSTTWCFINDGIIKGKLMRSKLFRMPATIGEVQTRLITMPIVVDNRSLQCPRCGSTHISVEERHATRDE